MRMQRGVVIAALLCVLLGSEGKAEQRQRHAAITYVGSVATSLLYVPLKVAYAGVGAFIGGAAYLLTAGDPEAFLTLWNMCAGGTYIVTPSMLEGTEPFRLTGKRDRRRVNDDR